MSRALRSFWQCLLAGCAAPELRQALQAQAEPALFAPSATPGDRP